AFEIQRFRANQQRGRRASGAACRVTEDNRGGGWNTAVLQCEAAGRRFHAVQGGYEYCGGVQQVECIQPTTANIRTTGGDGLPTGTEACEQHCAPEGCRA